MREQYQSESTTNATPSAAPAFPGAPPRWPTHALEASNSPQIRAASTGPSFSREEAKKFRTLIYGTGIRIPSSSPKTKEIAFSDLRYSRVSHFHFLTRRPLPAFRFCCAISPRINRKPELLEAPVSCRKQRPGTQINRKLSQAPCFPFSSLTFPFFDPNHQSRLSAAAQCYNGVLAGAAGQTNHRQPAGRESASNYSLQRANSGAEKRTGA
jgi:hypothetical protein